METSEHYQQPVILCNICDNLLCYEGYVKNHRGLSHSTKTTIFEVMFNYSIQELDCVSKIIGIYCSICQTYLGIKFGEKIYICREMYKCKPYKVVIKVFSLDSECIDFVKMSVENVRKKIKIDVEIEQEILLKSKLTNIDPNFEDCDGCILIHKNSGRLLLTDENGLYDHLIKLAYDKCIGNIFLAIYNNDIEEDPSEDNDTEKTNISSSEKYPNNLPRINENFKLTKSYNVQPKNINDSDEIDSPNFSTPSPRKINPEKKVKETNK